MSKLTPIQVIDLIVETYVKHPENRSTVSSGEEKWSCLYNGPNDKHCAFAMFVENPEVLQEHERAPHQLKNVPIRLKPEVAHITDPGFWGRVQCIHDGHIHDREDLAMMCFGGDYSRHRLFDLNRNEYIPERVTKYVEYLKQLYANYNPQSVQPGE